MPASVNKTGMRVGRLVVICEASERNEKGRKRLYCKCDCGNECTVNAADFYPGRSTSCGCYAKGLLAQRNASFKVHGHSGKIWSRTYVSWRSMHNRMLPSYACYERYAGRGITICERWKGNLGFENFLADMGTRPEGKSLDRIDTDGNYEPNNCKWSTPKEQIANRKLAPDHQDKMVAALAKGRHSQWGTPENKARTLAARRRK